TQGASPPAEIARGSEWPDGWLVRDQRLFSRRAPGQTCIASLLTATSPSKVEPNDSKGCGTVMRVAPIGLVFQPREAYKYGAESSALTHGHPTAIISGGAFALIIAHMFAGLSLPEAVAEARASVA